MMGMHFPNRQGKGGVGTKLEPEVLGRSQGGVSSRAMKVCSSDW